MRCMRVRAGVLIAVVCLETAVAHAQSADTTRAPIRPRSVAEDLQMFSQVLNQIRVNHPDSVDAHTLLMAAVEGMVRAADPHSFVIWAMRLDPSKIGRASCRERVSLTV